MDELRPMLNLVCRKARLAYGGRLRLDLGDLVEYNHPKLKGKSHGIWQVWSDSGSWRICDSQGLIAGYYDDEPVLDLAFSRLVNQRLLDIELSETSSDSRLRFSGSLFVDLLEISSLEANWEAIGPEACITFGPGPHSAISRPDEVGPGLTPEERQHSAHADECAERWKGLIPPRATDERCCSRCAYYMGLRGAWYFWDFGLCTNPRSSFDGKVVNVSTGCPEYADELEPARGERCHVNPLANPR